MCQSRTKLVFMALHVQGHNFVYPITASQATRFRPGVFLFLAFPFYQLSICNFICRLSMCGETVKYFSSPFPNLTG